MSKHSTKASPSKSPEPASDKSGFTVIGSSIGKTPKPDEVKKSENARKEIDRRVNMPMKEKNPAAKG